MDIGANTKFHAGLAAVVGFDSNVFSLHPDEGSQVAGYVFPSAWLGIGNRPLVDGVLMSPPERTERIIDYNLSVISGFRQYIARDEIVRSQPKLSVGTQGRFYLLPGRRFSLHLDEDFFRGADTSNYRVDGRLFNFNRIDHKGRLTMFLRPGGGRLSLSLGYDSELLRFAEVDVARGNRLVHGLTHETKWRFLPKSAVVFQYAFAYTTYLDCCTDVGRGRNEDSFAHRLMGGFRGLIGRKINLEVLVGWGLTNYRYDPNGPDFNSFIGRATFDYYPTLTTRLHAAVYRSFSDSLWGNYFVDNGANLLASHTFRWRMRASLGFGVVGRFYHGLPEPGVEDTSILGYEGRSVDALRQQSTLISLEAGLEQPVRKIFSFQLTYQLLSNLTDTTVLYDEGVPNQLGFTKQLLWLMAAVRI